MTSSPQRVLRSNREPTVFVVDADASVRESLEPPIREAGWTPELFSTAQAFLSYSHVRAPGCLLLDMTLPGMNGLDLQKLLARSAMTWCCVRFTKPSITATPDFATTRNCGRSKEHFRRSRRANATSWPWSSPDC
jgi:CheY-like chemotaxis protein